MEEADRLKQLPLYLFTIIDGLKAQAKARGLDVVDLGMGNPDLPAPPHVIEELCKQARDPHNHRYSRPNEPVEMKLKEAIAQFYQQRFHVTLDPKIEVLPLIGSKEGIANLCLTFLNHDDFAIVPNPAYPVHFNGPVMAGGMLHTIPTSPEQGFRPDLSSVSEEVLRRTKILFLSYPHNPTSAVVDLKFYQDAVTWAKPYPMMIASDLAYSDFVFDGYQAPSILQVAGAKAQCIEFHTCSKSYNMAGWRIGFVVGNRQVLASLAKMKSYMDFGIFRPVQLAAVAALTGPQDCVAETVESYRRRRDVFVDGLNHIGWKMDKPKGTFYVWARIPLEFSKRTSMEFAQFLVKEAGVVCAPGTGFGESGEGYVRFALVEPEDRLRIAVDRLKKLLALEH